MRGEPRQIETPSKRVFMTTVLGGIPRETIRMAGAQYLFPSPNAVREEEQTIAAGLEDAEEKKKCHEIYAELLGFLEAGRNRLKSIEATAGSHFLTDNENLILVIAGSAFEKAETIAKRIETKYERILESQERFDKSIDGIGPAEPHTVDKKI